MAAELLDVIKNIWAGGTTVILATHQATLAQRFKQRTLVLERGRLVKDG